MRQQCTGYSGRVLCDQAYKRFMQCRALERAAFPAPVITGARILSKTLGAMLTRIPLASLRRPPSAITGEELEIDTLLQSRMPDYSAYYSLRPEYNRESLKWLLDFMTQMKAYENLRRVALRDVTRQRIGWFIYYSKGGEQK